MRALLRRIKRLADITAYSGTGRWCPVCERTSRRFKRFGIVTQRPEAQCVHCGALERHRLAWLFFSRRTDLFDGRQKSVLHIAPERCFERRLRARLGAGYLTADLFSPRAMVKMDITDIQYPDETFDVIYCSHVLEHVPADNVALSEMHRVLKPSGWAIPLVPITAPATFEDLAVTDPNERLRLFGHDDHVRSYGPDFVDRLCAAGFDVVVTRPADLVAPGEIVTMGLTPVSGEIFYCSRMKGPR